MTADEARAACLANGLSASVCDETIAAQTVNGVYCDGTVVIDENGHRCVPKAVVDATAAARAASPLPPAPTSPWLFVGAAVVLAAAVVWVPRLVRRRR